MRFIGSKARFWTIASLLIGSSVFASGGGEEKPKQKVVLRPGVEEYKTVYARLKATAVKLKTSEETIQTLIHHKHKAHDPEHAKAIDKEILSEHKALRKTYADYEKDLRKLKYEHPDKGSSEERKYTRFRLKSLDELEQGAGLDADLEKAKLQLRKTYGEPTAEEKKAFYPPELTRPEPEEDDFTVRPTLKK